MKCEKCDAEIEENEICPYCEKIYQVMNFNVKGVTFENENGKDIQKEIRKIFLEYERNGYFEKYGGFTDAEIKELGIDEIAEFEYAIIQMELKEDTYKNKPCVKVYIKKYNDTYCHVGYMPKEIVKTYLKLKNDFKEMNITANLVGGKIKQLTYDYSIDKEKVEIVELNYGFEVSLIFLNDKDKYKQEIERKKQKSIEEYEKIRQDESKKIEENKQDESDRLKEQKRNARVGLIVYLGLIILSFFIMPIGILTLLIGILGFIICLATSF